MIQLVYCILAILILSILTMTSQQGIAGSLEGQTLVEVETQATGVATEILEAIDQTFFDRYTWLRRSTKPYCGRVYNAIADSLAAPGSFVPCADLATCTYIEGFDGLATVAAPISVERAGLTFNVDQIAVRYVDQDHAPLTDPTDRSYAKEVTVRVESPNLYFGTDPTNTFRITFSRVFEYGCATDFNAVPYVTSDADDFCPVDETPAQVPCARW